MITLKKDINNEDLPLTWRYYRYDDKILMVKNKVEQAIKLLVIVDPNGHYLGIVDHTIESDGYVIPSVVCPVKECTFHEFIKLEDFNRK